MLSNFSKSEKLLIAIFFCLLAFVAAMAVVTALSGCGADVDFSVEVNINNKKKTVSDNAIVLCPLADERDEHHMTYWRCVTAMTKLREEKKKNLEYWGCDTRMNTGMLYDMPESHSVVIKRVAGQLQQLARNYQECSPIANGAIWLYEQEIFPLIWKVRRGLGYWWYWGSGCDISEFIMAPVYAIEELIFRKEQLQNARENLAMLLKATACEDMLCVTIRAQAIGDINIGLYANSLNASDIGTSPTVLIKEWQKIVRLAYGLWVEKGMPEATDDDSLAAYLCDFALNAGNSFTVDIHDHGLTKAEVDSLNCDLRDWGDTILLHHSHKSNPFNHRRPRR